MRARGFLLALCILAGCAAGPDVPDAPVQGLAAAQAGLDAEGNPVVRPNGNAGPVPSDLAVPAPPRRGLFGLFGSRRAETAPGGAVPVDPPLGDPAPLPAVTAGNAPFGQVATACNLSRRDLGPAVDKHPDEGRARWKLHDPIPNSTGPRTQYVTGFRDRCARQTTGALVLFGSASVHETVRYGETNTRPYSATDTGYEQVKSRICGVRPRVPCPADRIKRLNRAVSFVTVYPRFGATEEWFEMLLVDGRLAASAMSGR